MYHSRNVGALRRIKHSAESRKAMQNSLYGLSLIMLLLASPCVGSFAGLVADRLPAGRPLLWGRSSCAGCGRILSFMDLVPILGWLINRGACRTCGARIAIRYPLIELAALAIALWSVFVLPGWIAFAGCLLGWSLMTLTIIDLDHLLLPDAITLPLIAAGFGVFLLIDPARLPAHGLGALAGFLLIMGLRLIFGRLIGREAVGLGDAKLLAAAGAWVSWEGLASVVLLAAGSALLVHVAEAVLSRAKPNIGSPGREIPFGPYIGGGLWLVWLYGPLDLAGIMANPL
jgi:leader peptidase (prepilin peptidase)/N-methyltransferase